MQLGQPQALWLLLLFPLLVLLIPMRRRRQQAFRRRLGDFHILQKTPFRFPRLHRNAIQFVLLVVPFLCFVVALADPQLPRGPLRLRAGVVDVVLLIDVSKSMLAEDYSRKSRLEKARQMARRFLSELRGNRLGIITFAGNSFRQAELTGDVRALDFILAHWVTEGSTGIGGSDLAGALRAGLALFPNGTKREQVMVLFSDGGDDGAIPDPILTQIAHRGVQIVIYGLGSIQPSRIPRYAKDGTFLGYLQENGHTLTTRLNETPLKRIAEATTGQYQRVVRQSSRPIRLSAGRVWGHLLTRDRQKLFQPFLLAGLLGCGMQLLVSRL